eukprot:scaffold140867_cov31-Tisochrysis_lutea.AAC.2
MPMCFPVTSPPMTGYRAPSRSVQRHEGVAAAAARRHLQQPELVVSVSARALAIARPAPPVRGASPSA